MPNVSIKMPAKGRMVQMPSGEVWVSPQHNLQYAFPAWVRMALMLYEQKAEQIHDEMNAYFTEVAREEIDEAMGEVAKVMAKFIETSNGPHIPVKEAAEESGYTDLGRLSKVVFSRFMLDVIISAYYSSVQESTNGKAENFLYIKPQDILDHVVSE